MKSFYCGRTYLPILIKNVEKNIHCISDMLTFMHYPKQRLDLASLLNILPAFTPLSIKKYNLNKVH